MEEVWTCSLCGVELSEKYHIDGADYCPDHARNIVRRPAVWDESVRGIVIGGDATVHYEFWYDGRKQGECEAAHDGAAILWFKTTHPEQYARGAEMRAFDV